MITDFLIRFLLEFDQNFCWIWNFYENLKNDRKSWTNILIRLLDDHEILKWERKNLGNLLDDIDSFFKVLKLIAEFSKKYLILLQFCDIFGVTFIHKIHINFDTLIGSNIHCCSLDFGVSKKHFCLNFTIIFLGSFPGQFGTWQCFKSKPQGSTGLNSWIGYEL